MKITSLLREGLEGRRLTATFLFYLIGLALAAPVTLLIARRGGEEAVYRSAPWVAITLLGAAYLFCYGGKALVWLSRLRLALVSRWNWPASKVLPALFSLSRVSPADVAIVGLVFGKGLRPEQAGRQLGCQDDASARERYFEALSRLATSSKG